MKPITTSVYTFPDLIDGGYLYIDKTAEIYKFIGEFKGQYFLSRPRRFGKSLLVSTLETVFKGGREYFKGLALDSLPYDWKAYPVLHLDLGSVQPQDALHLNRILEYTLDSACEKLGVTVVCDDLPTRFKMLIEKLAAGGRKVVILIDEYDKPILGHLGKPDVTDIKNALKAFYSVIKTTEGLQRFALITGVSKFSKVSIFSDLNNLTDLTMDARAATLLGYTKEEVAKYFADRLPLLAGAVGKTPADTFSELERWYDGYRFHWGAEPVFNPVSVGRCFDACEFKNYWFETGTPTFLVDLLKEQPVNPGDITATEDDFGTYEPEKPAMVPLLVQTGYLTIKGHESALGTMLFRLGFPNKEVGDSFSRWLAEGLGHLQQGDMTSFLVLMDRSLRADDAGGMLDAMSIFFANIPNTIVIQNEKYYQALLYAALKLMGAAVEVEVSTNVGRIDAVVKTRGSVFVFEFKLNGTAREAVAQIREKRYFEKYLSSGRRIVLVGVAFDAAKRNIGERVIEAL